PRSAEPVSPARRGAAALAPRLGDLAEPGADGPPRRGGPVPRHGVPGPGRAHEPAEGPAAVGAAVRALPRAVLVAVGEPGGLWAAAVPRRDLRVRPRLRSPAARVGLVVGPARPSRAEQLVGRGVRRLEKPAGWPSAMPPAAACPASRHSGCAGASDGAAGLRS